MKNYLFSNHGNTNIDESKQKRPMRKNGLIIYVKRNAKSFRRARNRYKSCKSMDNLDVLKNTCTSYKVAIKNAMIFFQNKFNKKLRILLSY